MGPQQFARLVENIRTDGRLTSHILACQNGDGSIEILSGHHRVLAAIEVGITEIEAIVITTPLIEQRKVAIQLSHNAIAGKDDASLLRELYKELGLDAKMFSGLTDEVLDFNKMSITYMAPGVKYEELRFAFLPDDKVSFEQVLKRVKLEKDKVSTHVASYADFDKLFDTIIRVKETKNVANSAMALAILAELANERLDQLDHG